MKRNKKNSKNNEKLTTPNETNKYHNNLHENNDILTLNKQLINKTIIEEREN